MYRFIDREVEELERSERLLVLAMRDWVLAAKRGRCPVDAVTLRFLSHRLVGGLEPFNAVMELLARHGRQKLTFACPCFPRVSEGEAILLATLLPGKGSRRSVASRGAHLVESGRGGRLALALREFESALMLAGMG